MQNQGEIVACDVRGEALAELEKRAARAGATIIKTLPLDHAQPSGPFDLVLVDAPCSGTGTWRRQPELRWRLTPGAAGGADRHSRTGCWTRPPAWSRPGGRLVYATCSVLPVENQDRVAAFLARHPGFAPAESGGSLARHRRPAWARISAPARPSPARTAFTAQA